MCNQSWLILSAFFALSCGANEQGLALDLREEAEVPAMAPAPEPEDESDTFRCFAAGSCKTLALASSTACRRDRDYTITANPTRSPVVVLSIHGGLIESNTSEISREAARRFGWSHYDFAGHGTPDCLRGKTTRERLHITATNFDEPIAMELVSKHQKVVSIHGDRFIFKIGTMCIGGDNAAQVRAFISSINANKSSFAEFLLRPLNARHSTDFPCNAVPGIDKFNIVNRAPGNKGGLQLELSLPLLKKLASPDPRYLALQQIFYNALDSAIQVPEGTD